MVVALRIVGRLWVIAASLEAPVAAYRPGPCDTTTHPTQITHVDRVCGVDVVVGIASGDGVCLGESSDCWEVDSGGSLLEVVM